MMMIDFIIIQSGLVPLIGGLCAKIYFRFEIIDDFAFLLFFLEEKICQRKKRIVQDIIPSASKYIHMSTLYTYENAHIPDLVHVDSSGPPATVSHPDPWAHNRVPHMCSVCVCVCAYTHTYTHIHSHPR